ncbi:hypothetical protein BDY24DRAFT_404114 [Mrakia frigida]|uniref:uncharacterized protein n=1 Tax=Mrakia frigida TaxID=29902 RepID=UPI003FCC0089
MQKVKAWLNKKEAKGSLRNPFDAQFRGPLLPPPSSSSSSQAFNSHPSLFLSVSKSTDQRNPLATMPTFVNHPNLFFLRNPVRWLRVSFIEYPVYSWSVAIGGTAEVAYFGEPAFQYMMGWNDERRLFKDGAPAVYPVPDRPRKPVDPKYDDPVGPVTTAINAARAPATA